MIAQRMQIQLISTAAAAATPPVFYTATATFTTIAAAIPDPSTMWRRVVEVACPVASC